MKAEENEEVVNDNSNMTTFKVKYAFRSPRLVQVEEEYLIYNALSVLANVGGKFSFVGLVPLNPYGSNGFLNVFVF